jgi:hypothetical protein
MNPENQRNAAEARGRSGICNPLLVKEIRELTYFVTRFSCIQMASSGMVLGKCFLSHSPASSCTGAVAEDLLPGGN